MTRSIFVTGASGFIGQCLVQRWTAATDYSVKVLTRRPLPERASKDGQLQQVVGDLLDPETYRAAIAGCDAVVHLAAVTGRAAPEEYELVNVEGTAGAVAGLQSRGSA